MERDKRVILGKISKKNSVGYSHNLENMSPIQLRSRNRAVADSNGHAFAEVS